MISKTKTIKPDDAGILVILTGVAGGADPTPEKIEDGIFLTNHWNFDMFLPDEKKWEKYWARGSYIHDIGVCDSIQQLKDKYWAELSKDKDYEYVVSFAAVLKSEQFPEGGWRWHKWGEYIGSQKPTMEYLYDEPLIDKVFTYHILRKKL